MAAAEDGGGGGGEAAAAAAAAIAVSLEGLVEECTGGMCDDDMSSDEDMGQAQEEPPAMAVDASAAVDAVVTPPAARETQKSADASSEGCSAAGSSAAAAAVTVGDRPPASPARGGGGVGAGGAGARKTGAGKQVAQRVACLKDAVQKLQQEKAAHMEQEAYLEAQRVKLNIAEHAEELESIRTELLSAIPQKHRRLHKKVTPPGNAASAAASTQPAKEAAAPAAPPGPAAPVEGGAAAAAPSAEGEEATAAAALAEGAGAASSAQAGEEVEEEEEKAEEQAAEEAAADSQFAWAPCEEGDFMGLAKDESAPPRFRLPMEIFCRLYDYQRTGVAWLARLWQRSAGGILADEMGLGKTIQICAVLNGARKAGASHALILLPVTLLEQWRGEAEKWCPGWPVYVYHGDSQQRAAALQGIRTPQGGILLTTYSMLSNTDILFTLTIGGEAAAKAAGDGAGSPSNKGGRPSKRQKTQANAEAAASTSEAIAALHETPPGELLNAGDVKVWDFVVCDEAHRMKSISSLFSKSIRQVRAKCRLLLTGTPVQNALQDLWALADYAMPGLLGNHPTFVKTICDPIDKGSVRGASAFQVALKRQMAAHLRELLKPYVLRRTKKSAGLILEGNEVDEDVEEYERILEDEFGEALDKGAEQKALPPKRETVIWLMPSEEQSVIYQKVLEKSEIVREAADKSKLGIEVFLAIGLLKRLCNHPLLALPSPPKQSGYWKEVLGEAMGSLGEGQRSGGAGTKAEARGDTADLEDRVVVSEATADPLQGEAGLSSGSVGTVSDDARAGRAAELLLKQLPRDAESLLAQSAKLRCLALLLPSLSRRGHRTLVFSQSVKMLDLVQICVLKPHGLRCLRIDGQTDASSRAEKVNKFNSQLDRFQCMLLTTAVGGVGLNLTSADRVILIDPSWNPAMDEQAVARAYRIGQDKEVRVYRLITSGFIEDKMFRLQTFKLGLTKTALENEDSKRIFTQKEIRNLFSWTEPAEGETRRHLVQAHGSAAGEEAMLQACREDGSEADGWLGDWLAAGASDLAGVHGSAVSSAETQQSPEKAKKDDIEAEIQSAKQKLSQADEEMQRAVEARKAAEERADSANKEAAEMDAAIKRAQADKEAFDTLAKDRRKALKQLEKDDDQVQKRVEKMLKKVVGAQEKQQQAAQAELQSMDALAATALQLQEAAEPVQEADEAFRKTVKAIGDAVGYVNEDGSPADHSCVDTTQAVAKKAKQASRKFLKALEEMTALRQRLSSLGEDYVAMEKADPASEEREQTRERLETASQELATNLEAAKEALATASGDLTEAGLGLADKLSKTEESEADKGEVRATIKFVKDAFKALGPAWSGLRRSQDAYVKAAAAYWKASRKYVTLSASRAQADKLLAEAVAEQEEAHKEAEKLVQDRQDNEAKIAEAETASQQAEASAEDLRRKKEELKEDAAAAKEAIKPAKQAERKAALEHRSVVRQSSKVEKKEQRVEEKKQLAIRRLQSETYNKNQVEEAYYLRSEYFLQRKNSLNEENGGSSGSTSTKAPTAQRLESEQQRRAEVIALGRLQRARRALTAAQEQKSKFLQASEQAAEAAAGAEKASQDTASQARAAEFALSAAVEAARAALGLVDGEGNAVGQKGVVDTPVALVHDAQKALVRLQSEQDTAAIRQAEFESLEEDLVALELEAQRDAAEPSGGETSNESSKKRSEVAEFAEWSPEERELQRQELEEAYPKIVERGEAARAATAKAVSEVVEAGLAFVEGLQPTASREEVDVAEVKAATSQAKSAFKSLGPAWVVFRKAQEAWTKATAARHRAVKKLKAASTALRDTEAALVDAEKEQAEAGAEEQATRAAGLARDRALQEEAAERLAAQEAAEEEAARIAAEKKPGKRLNAKTSAAAAASAVAAVPMSSEEQEDSQLPSAKRLKSKTEPKAKAKGKAKGKASGR
eukprot:TRINITY_DN4608_c1_g1_i1.p1 TRINITY_DN4608_c1_g1~~TRINITY_DN4608_c1_g1_i1.p1  ORF type:complete len:1931 (+),score=735.71 TRINITY_DN4608_c1_g1_i1:109-5901(+)